MSNDIGRGTTPSNRFRVSIDLRDMAVVWLTYKQGSRIVIQKIKDDLEIGEDHVVAHLTQKETLALSDKVPVRMQFRVRTVDGKALKSGVMVADVSEILKDGVI